jgi:multicomponent Na+:H+ antiporter subunit A
VANDAADRCGRGAACLSMAGFPLFFGFIGKEIMYEGALAKEMYPVFAVTMALLANSLMTAVAAIVLLGPFFGPTRAPQEQIHEAPWTMWLGPLVLGGLGILFGLIPEWVSHALIEPAVRAFHPGPEDIRLVFFHGLNLPLLLSMVTLSCGAALYLLRRRVCRLVVASVQRLPVTSEGLYDRGLSGFMKAADLLTGRLQNGSLHFYLAVIIGSLIVAVGWPWIGNLAGIFSLQPGNIDGTALALFVFVAGAVSVVVTARKRLAAIGGIGGVGAGVALIFLLFGAPDIALTQLLVETLTVIFVSLVMLRLPAIEQARRRSVRRRCLDGGLALAGGLLLASLLIGVGSEPLDRSLTSYFEANSYLAAHGRNIVNVILVDFRSFDTLGEIIVVVLAAWAAVTLIRKPMEP